MPRFKLEHYDYDTVSTARENHRADYTKRFPPPERPTMAAFWNDIFVRIMLLLTICAALLSATRTFPVFKELAGDIHPLVANLEGVLSTIVVEGAALTLAYFLVVRLYRQKGVISEMAGWVTVALLLAIVLGLIANLYFTFNAADIREADSVEVKIGIALSTGLFATLMLFFCAHILGVEFVQHLADYDTAMDKYKTNRDEWQTELDNDWNKTSVQRVYVQTLVQNDDIRTIQATVQNPVQSPVQSYSATGFARIAEQNQTRLVEHSDKTLPEQVADAIADNGWYDLSIGKLQRQMPSISRGSIHAGKQLAIQRRQDNDVT